PPRPRLLGELPPDLLVWRRDQQSAAEVLRRRDSIDQIPQTGRAKQSEHVWGMQRCSGGEVDAALGLCSALVDHGDAFQLAEAPQEVEHEHRLADACKNRSAGN